MTIPVHLVSVDDLIASLTRIAAIADSTLYQRSHSGYSIKRKPLEQIRDEALDAIARAEEAK